jgi:hypothetical protein
VWDVIPTPQFVDTPFNATLRAVDAAGTTLTGFNGVANLSVLTAVPGNTIGTGDTSLSTTIYTYYHDSRSNSLYKAAEIGGATRLTGLALNVTSFGSSQALTNLTIRLKHTALTSLNSTSSWDNSGWTQVYRASPTISANGWVTFAFDTPFDYNGSSNLLVDISIDRTTTSGSALYVQGSSTADVGTIYGYSDSAYGDPLTWSGSTPYPNGYYQRADIRLTTQKPVPIRPAISGAFSSGVWTGQLSVPVTGTGLVLKAQAGTATGSSNALNVVAPTVTGNSGATVLAETFESGALNPAIWTITGTGGFHTIASSANGPHAGAWHMTMDEATGSGSYARNEATLTVNLAGRSGARLSFWA